MAKENKTGKESIEFTYAEMDLIFLALEQIKKDSEKVMTSAGKLMAKSAESELVKFKNKVEELQTKFLH